MSMQPLPPKLLILASAFLLGLASVAVAHGHDDNRMDMAEPALPRPTLASAGNATTQADVQTYFRYSEHSGLLMAHIILMTVAWVFVLPIGKWLLEN